MQRAGNIIQNALQSTEVSLTNDGALVVKSGEHTGRCPSAKRVVRDSQTEDTVDWSANQSMSPSEWQVLWDNVKTYISAWRDHGKEFYEQVGAAGRETKWSSRTMKKFKFVCENPVQLQFVNNMFDCAFDLRDKELECEVYCLPSMSTDPTVAINFTEKKIVITGTYYLGEIKKSVFTYMNYILTESGILPMHCSVNVDSNKTNPAIFFGLSGTGKTTLSSSEDRILLGDDEHGWVPGVIFNIESGCYAKTVALSVESEPEIYKAANKFGSIFENVVMKDGVPDFYDTSITKNGRVSYPLSHFENYVEEGFVFGNPKNIIMLTCDAFGVLPPVSKLSHKQAREMFLLGYTSKVAGTETGVTEPQAVFSPCFGAPFLPRNPSVYADLLESFVSDHNIDCWLVNTGWVGGGYGVGERMKLSQTRDIIKSILDTGLNECHFYTHDQTGFVIPTNIPDHPEIPTFPEEVWKNERSYNKAASDLMTQMKEKLKAL